MATTTQSSAKRPQPPLSPSEADLVHDFAHLGLAVRSGSRDESNADETDHAKIAARAAAIKLAEPPKADDEVPSEIKQFNTAQTTKTVDQSSSGSIHQSVPPAVQTDEVPAIPAKSPDRTSQVLPRSQPPHDTLETTVAEPVVHETVKVENVEIRQEVVHKEVHEYHEVTHILPVIETEVLPARHFVLQEDGTKVEIPAPKGLAQTSHSVV